MNISIQITSGTPQEKWNLKIFFWLHFPSFKNVYWEGNVVMVSQASITPELRMHAHIHSLQRKHSHALALSHPPSLRTHDELVSHERTCTRTMSYLCASWELQDWSSEPAKYRKWVLKFRVSSGSFPGYFGIWHKNPYLASFTSQIAAYPLAIRPSRLLAQSNLSQPTSI